MPWLTAWKKQVRSIRTASSRSFEDLVPTVYSTYSLLMFICNEIAVDRLFVSDVYDCGSLLVTIHMLHCQLKPLILIVYAAYPVGCGCRRVQCDQIARGVPTLVVWLHHETTLMATRSIGFSSRMHGRLRMGTRTYRPTAGVRRYLQQLTVDSATAA